MSRAKIKDLYWELTSLPASSTAWDDAREIEVVPRKIVEMIIKKCKDHASGPRPSDYIVGVSDEAGCIAKYAESLLKQFEEDKE